MEPVTVQLFGSFQVGGGGWSLGPRDFGGVKPKQILEVLLLADGHPVAKDRLADLLWGEDLPQHVSATIETYVSVLRRRLGHDRSSELLVTGAGAYRVNKSAAVVDLDRFDALVSRATEADAPRRRELLEDALGLVRGEVLEDEPYAPWADYTRRDYRQRITRARIDAAQAALADHDPRRAVAHAAQALEIDPLEEAAHRVSIVARYAAGSRHEALEAYQHCRTVLDEHLGLDPDKHTEAVQAAILDGADPERLVTDLARPATSASPTARPRTSLLQRRALRVLLVEDNPADVRLISEALSTGSVPVHVECADEADTALRWLCRALSAGTLPDLVLLDLHLPGRGGLELLADLKADPHLLHIPVVVLTSSIAATDVARSFELHANSYVPKPMDADDFAEVVRAIEAFWPLTVTPPVASSS